MIPCRIVWCLNTLGLVGVLDRFAFTFSDRVSDFDTCGCHDIMDMV